jgi:phosphoglycolate phosphatase
MKSILIFDYDGVLIDSLDIFMDRFIFSCKKHGFNLIDSKNVFLELFDENMYDMMMKKGMSHDLIHRVIQTLNKELLLYMDKMPVFKGVPETLRHLSKHHILYVITSNDSYLVDQFLTRNNITFFQDVLGGDKGKSKVEKITKIKGNYDDKDFFYIGDTRGDMIEGKNAGVKTVAVTWGWHEESRLLSISPDFMVSSPVELLSLFLSG